MPCVAEIDVVEIAGPGDKLLGTSPLLGRAAEEYDGTVHIVGLHVIPDREGGAEAARSEQVMTAAVSAV